MVPPAHRIALYGGSFNPPGSHHRRIAESLAESFDRVLVVPCGPRTDKVGTDEVDPDHRAAMVGLAFRGLPGVEVDLFDLEEKTFTRTFDLEPRYRTQGEVWLVVGTDLIVGGARGRSPIQFEWYRGEELWMTSRFAVLTRAGVSVDPHDLPPQAQLVRGEFEGSSTEIRRRIHDGGDWKALVTPEVAEYIDRHGLYSE